MLACQGEVKQLRDTPRSFPGLRNHLPPHVQSLQSERQNIIDRMHTWQHCSVTMSKDILTTKYGFNLRQISPLKHDNNTRLETQPSLHRTALRLCTNQSEQSQSWHAFEATFAGSRAYASITPCFMRLNGSGK